MKTLSKFTYLCNSGFYKNNNEGKYNTFSTPSITNKLIFKTIFFKIININVIIIIIIVN